MSTFSSEGQHHQYTTVHIDLVALHSQDDITEIRIDV